MKLRLIIFVITISMFVTLTGCGSSKSTTDATPTSSQPTTQTQPDQKTQPQQTPETKAPTPAPQPSPPPAVTTPAPPQTQNKEVTVYVTKTGEKYHSAGCRYLSKSQIPISLSAAKASYGPCSVCNPPR